MGTDGEGVIYTGDNGKLMTAFMGQDPRVLSKDGKMTMPFGTPAKKEEPFQPSRPELGGSASSADAAHFLEWVHACQGGPPARANYAYEAPIVETLMLGCIAVRTHEVLEWDAENFRLTARFRPGSGLAQAATSCSVGDFMSPTFPRASFDSTGSALRTGNLLIRLSGAVL